MGKAINQSYEQFQWEIKGIKTTPLPAYQNSGRNLFQNGR